MPERFTVQVFNTVDDIKHESIDAISNDGFFTYGWFKALEQQKDFIIHPFYIAVYNNCELVAFAPCFLDKYDQYFTHGLLYLPFMKEILALGSKLGLWQKHLLLCYSPFCFRSKIMINESYSKKEILQLIHKKVEGFCKKERILFSSFPFVSELDNHLLASLKNSGYLQLPWKSTFYIAIHWSSFEEYLASFNCRVRRNIKREIRKCLESGITIDENPNINSFSEKIADLSSNLFQKHNQSPLLGKSFFRSLSENAKDNTKLFIAEKNGELIGFSLLMKQKGVLDCFTCGFNYDLLSNTDFAYFNLGYYLPIRWAIREGFSKIYYRISADKVKLYRGCSQEQIFSNVKCHNRLLAIFFNFYAKMKHGKSCR